MSMIFSFFFPLNFNGSLISPSLNREGVLIVCTQYFTEDISQSSRSMMDIHNAHGAACACSEKLYIGLAIARGDQDLWLGD